MLKAVFFGVPQLHHNYDALTETLTGRCLALFTYLALSEQPQDRGHLADLLWSEVGEKQARQNLRYVLYDLRKLVGDYLVISRNTLAFAHDKPSWIDARVFTTHLTHKETVNDPALLQGVLQLYQSEFLTGFFVQNAPGFEEWLVEQRQRFHHQATQGLLLLIERCLSCGDYAMGLSASRRLLQLEPWHEEAHRYQMCLLAYNGQRLDALAQYTTCCQVLQAEFGVGPEEATTTLFHAIEAGKLTPPSRSGGTSFSSSLQVNWDAVPQMEHMVGRTTELAQLHHWVMNPQHRLIGLFGLAGQGKSTIATELIMQLAEPPTLTTAAPASPVEVILWATLTTFPTLMHLLQEWLAQLTKTTAQDVARLLAPTPPLPTAVPTEPLETLLQRLITQLRNRRVLLVIDAGEALYRNQGALTEYQTGWEAFDELLRRLADNEHRSCLLFLSRITPAAWEPLARRCSALRTLTLPALSLAESLTLLHSGGHQTTVPLQDLAEQCAGHPQTLVAVRELLHTFGSALLTTPIEKPLLPGRLLRTLQVHVMQLSALEQSLLLQLTLLPNPPTAATLWQQLPNTDTMSYLEALQTLHRHHLLLPSRSDGELVLSPLVKRFMEQHLLVMSSQQSNSPLLPPHESSPSHVVDVEAERLQRHPTGKMPLTDTFALIY